MSNGRRPARGNRYRTGFLRSPQWFARRDRWFVEQEQRAGQLSCIVCKKTATKRVLELHHLDYRGVKETSSGWRATEAHEDLVACHKHCHSLIHRLIDRDIVLRKLRTRRVASLTAIKGLQRKMVEARKADND